MFLSLLLSTGRLEAQTVVALQLNGTINPAAADFIHRSIEKAASENAECLIIELNTPGGLLESTRNIVRDILGAEIPVIVYVAPSGAHAGSAGVFITLASAVAVMAPGTNLGAAHPVDLQGQTDTIMTDKATNDAAAFIRSISEHRHRNGEWAELAVRKSVSLSENEAISQKVIDLIAANMDDLLQKLDGRTVSYGSHASPASYDSSHIIPEGFTKVLHTRKARVEYLKMGFVDKFLDLISNPNFTYILFLLGLYGILFELYNPGSILPGIVGVISLILAFYAMQTLPVNYAGAALIIFAVLLFLLDIKIASHGLLAIGGVVSLLLGSIMLIRPGPATGFTGVSKVVIISATVITALFFLTIIGIGLRAQRGKPVTGPVAMQGAIGESIDLLAPAGTVKVQGEYWRAEAVGDNIGPGEKVRVISVRDLVLLVDKV